MSVTGPTADHLVRHVSATAGQRGSQLRCTCGARSPYLPALPSADRWAATVHPRPRRSLTGALSATASRILAAVLTRKEVRHA